LAEASGAPLAAVTSTIAFVTFTVWWLIDGGAGLDSMMLRFTGWLLHGAPNVAVSDSWPLGEPEVALTVIAVVAALLIRRRMSRTAALIVGGFLVLSAVQLMIVLLLADIRHVRLDIDARSHLYPSGHTARVPFLGSALAVIAPRSARRWILAVTALLAVALALDRTDSTIQTGSVVVGGLLLGSPYPLGSPCSTQRVMGHPRARPSNRFDRDSVRPPPDPAS
jgi:hypothetical protein